MIRIPAGRLSVSTNADPHGTFGICVLDVRFGSAQVRGAQLVAVAKWIPIELEVASHGSDRFNGESDGPIILELVRRGVKADAAMRPRVA